MIPGSSIKSHVNSRCEPLHTCRLWFITALRLYCSVSSLKSCVVKIGVILHHKWDGQVRERKILGGHEDISRVLKDLIFILIEKSVSEIQDVTTNLWEEDRVEDKLSPEEIQMVRPHWCHHTWRCQSRDSYSSNRLLMSSFTPLWVLFLCVAL